jgi:hypothetical protein
MAGNEEIEFKLPSIPYFYHDLVARIVPGAIQIGLICALLAHHCPECINKLNLSAILSASQVGMLLGVLAGSYLIGVFFEGLLYFSVKFGKTFANLYHIAFASALNEFRLNLRVSGKISKIDTAIMAEEASSILESYEPLVPHFFARAARFLAEAKMMLYSAVAIPLAVIIVFVLTGKWWPPGGWRGIMTGLILIILFLTASFARHRRRAVEILRCVNYLSLRAEPADAKQRAGAIWRRVLDCEAQETA